MAVLQMQKIGICALKKDRQEILEKIQTLGTIELSDDKSLKELDGFVTTDTKEISREFSKKLSLTEQALEVMDTFSPETKGMFSSLEGKPLIEKEKLMQEMQNAKAITELAEQVISWSKEYSENKALVAKINEKIEGLKPWQELDIPFDLTETKKTKVLIGTMPPDMDEAKIHELVQKKCDEEVDIDLEVVCMDSDAAYIVVIAKKDVSGKVEDALRSGGFAKSSLGYDKTPREQIEKLEADIESINQTSEELEKKITEAAESRDKLREACDYFRMRLKNVEVTGELRQSERTFVMTGFIPKDKASRVKELLEGSFDCVIELADVTDEDEAPTVLKNNSFSSSAEGVLESYGLPKLRDIDPTKVMSYFYVFFFGMMLSDAAYGLLMSIGCFIVLKKFPKMEEGMKKMLKLFGFCGLSTLFWGVMFGGYFGDAPTVIAKTFFGKEFTIKPLWFAPLDNPMRLLIWCMLFGVIHLFAGLAIKGFQELKEGKVIDCICDVVFWYMFLIGLILLLLPTDIFASISQMTIKFPASVVMLSKVLTIAGMLGILLMSGRGHKNVALRVALGAYDIYGVTGWLSDVLSYSRLLALGLATGVIASVINMMGSMVGGGVLGAIIFTIVFIFGHAMNMAINVLGAYVHTNRLQFVEFFGKFYEGGGKPFEPLTTESKYIEIK